MTNKHPRSGIEFDWIAADQDGNIALMSTAGYGNCPTNEFVWMENMDQLADAIAALSEPPTDDPLTARSTKGPIIYDWRHWNGPYVRIHIPGSIITTSILMELGMDSELVVKIRCRFVETEEIFDNKIGKL